MGHLGLTILAILATGACASYLDIRTQEVDSSEHGTSPGPRGTTCKCGWANKGQTRIVNGRNTLVNEFPFIVAVIDTSANNFQFCGGTIITPNVVVTAAHCTYKFAQDGSAPISVVAGEHNLNAENNTAKRSYHVDRIVGHEGYENITHSYDISLLFVNQGIQFTKLIGPACISQQRRTLTNQYVKIIGWGNLWTNGPGSPILQKVNVRGVDGQECSNVWGVNSNNSQRSVDPARHLCTYSNNKSFCQGDSGGPVVWINPDTNRFELVGAVSFGNDCADRFPGVNTDVTAYLDWIRNAINRYAPGNQMCYML